MKKFKFGFTFIEVMVAVAIVALLTLISIWALRKYIVKGFDARRKTDIYQIKVALEEYEKDHNCYPSEVMYQGGSILNPYLSNVPKDPRTKEAYSYSSEGDTSCARYYYVFANMESEEDENCPTGCGNYNYYLGSSNSPILYTPPPTQSPTPEPSSAPSTPSPTVPPTVNYYGCFSGNCFQLSPGGVLCQPNYRESASCGGNFCKNEYGQPINECL